MNIKSLTVAVSALVLSTSVNAAIVDNGDFLTDTESGLDWYKLSNTSGYSYNDVVNETGNTGLFDGWSVATGGNLGQFLSKTSAESLNTVYFGDGWVGHAYAIYDCPANDCGNPNPTDYVITASIGDSWSLMNHSTWGKDSAVDNATSIAMGSTLSTALVRTSVVPIPAAAWLFGSGLIGLIGVARRKSA